MTRKREDETMNAKLEKIHDMYDLQLAVKQSGSHFFDKDTMRFFRSRLAPDLEQCDRGILFITSEQYVSYEPYRVDPRRYTLHLLEVKENGELYIGEVGEFQEHVSLRQARKAMKGYMQFVHSLP
jgi:hypothetical protein